MTAGRLDQRIDIQERVPAENTLGELVKDWANRHTQISAGAYPLRGREFFAASQPQSEFTTRFRIRYRPGLTAQMRVIWRGVAYDIAADPIIVNGRNEWIDLMCKSGVKDAKS